MPTLIKFKYLNHNGEDHTYVVRIGPTSLIFKKDYKHENNCWHIQGEVIRRDGKERPGFRAFKLTEIRDLKEVEAA